MLHSHSRSHWLNRVASRALQPGSSQSKPLHRTKQRNKLWQAELQLDNTSSMQLRA
jgi:hypothetical protein